MSKSERRKPLVLVAEDDLELSILMAEGLARSGYEVVTARDGARALEQLHSLDAPTSSEVRARPDLVITDLRLPGYSGLELVELVRLLLPNVPVIVISASGNQLIRTAVDRLFASAYLQKPFEITELIRIAHRCAPPGT